ncbi:hypothetical protein [Streptomyces cucumeris]|uniref:hypothetical protein n=1 Tax=Streptomyces cucumeris TaxID=2962890 RepID=UPI0020C8DCCE|nr:hypothetical protein [Streptomyces sp. NEAU-Y11]MCP9209679.1 hypothetical protein [Streptomyces sp. NEAU-Y11]
MIVIVPVEDDDPHQEIRRVRIRVSPKGGRDHPSLPLLQKGMLYRDRTGVKYTILAAMVCESGIDDGEPSIWTYDYLAAIGVHALTGVEL